MSSRSFCSCGQTKMWFSKVSSAFLLYSSYEICYFRWCVGYCFVRIPSYPSVRMFWVSDLFLRNLFHSIVRMSLFVRIPSYPAVRMLLVTDLFLRNLFHSIVRMLLFRTLFILSCSAYVLSPWTLPTKFVPFDSAYETVAYAPSKTTNFVGNYTFVCPPQQNEWVFTLSTGEKGL